MVLPDRFLMRVLGPAVPVGGRRAMSNRVGLNWPSAAGRRRCRRSWGAWWCGACGYCGAAGLPYRGPVGVPAEVRVGRDVVVPQVRPGVRRTVVRPVALPVARRGSRVRRGDLEAVLLAEGLVDLEQHLLLPLVERGIGEDDRTRLHVVPVALGVEDAGPHVQRLGGDPQGLGDLLQHLRARLAQPALDLAQIRIGHPGGIGELPERQLRGAPLFTQIVTEIADVERCHASTVHHSR